jgi:hypothetical protein
MPRTLSYWFPGQSAAILLRRASLALALAGVLGCGESQAPAVGPEENPDDPPVVGTYDLKSVDYQSLPMKYPGPGQGMTEVLSGTIEIDDSTWVHHQVVRYYPLGSDEPMAPETQSGSGTYVLVGDSLRLNETVRARGFSLVRVPPDSLRWTAPATFPVQTFMFERRP